VGAGGEISDVPMEVGGCEPKVDESVTGDADGSNVELASEPGANDVPMDDCGPGASDVPMEVPADDSGAEDATMVLLDSGRGAAVVLELASIGMVGAAVKLPFDPGVVPTKGASVWPVHEATISRRRHLSLTMSKYKPGAPHGLTYVNPLEQVMYRWLHLSTGSS
jgi:hypothetical protein